MHRQLATVQGVYYLVTGLWPIVSMRSFEWVTGRKTDRWLVRMVGLLAAAIGLALLRGRDEPIDPALPVASAAAFTAVDVVYAAKGTISPIYLGDAVVELGLIAGWLRNR
jgi:hypothetical protein